MASELTYGLIGVGKMGEPVLQNLLASGVVNSQIIFSVRDDNRAAQLSAQYGITRKSNREIAKHADVLIVGVKPQGIEELLSEIAGEFEKPSLLISILAGKKTSYFEERLPKNIRVIRTMPNTPLMVGQGVIAISLGASATAADKTTVENIFKNSAQIHFIPEELQDAFAAVAGSGPAYFYAFVEGLAKAGVEAGLTSELSEKIAIETFIGAAKLLAETGLSPQTARENVTSPKGMTAEGLNSFTQDQLSQIITRAVQAAKARSIELS